MSEGLKVIELIADIAPMFSMFVIGAVILILGLMAPSWAEPARVVELGMLLKIVGGVIGLVGLAASTVLGIGEIREMFGDAGFYGVSAISVFLGLVIFGVMMAPERRFKGRD